MLLQSDLWYCNYEVIRMPKSERQKLKLLYLRDYLCKNTDEAHPAGMQSIIDYLAAQGIPAERKSI